MTILGVVVLVGTVWAIIFRHEPFWVVFEYSFWAGLIAGSIVLALMYHK